MHWSLMHGNLKKKRLVVAAVKSWPWLGGVWGGVGGREGVQVH